MPHPSIFFLGFRTIRCQSREEYELFQESGAIDSTDHRGHPSCMLQTLHLSIPRFFFHDQPQSFPLQNTWVDHIKELCSSIGISVGSIKADIMYYDIYENPLYTFSTVSGKGSVSGSVKLAGECASLKNRLNYWAEQKFCSIAMFFMKCTQVKTAMYMLSLLRTYQKYHQTG